MEATEIIEVNEEELMAYTEPELDEMEDISLCAGWLSAT
jgi:hypothetical protein